MSEAIKINMTLELDDDFLECIMCTAFEGGSDYWAFARNVERDNYNYISYELCDEEEYYDEEEDEEAVKWALVNKQTVAEGCRISIEKGQPYAEYILQKDAGMIDANDADCIIQYACFGELVYG